MKERRTNRKKRGIPVPLIGLLVVCVLVLGYSIFQLAGIFLEYKEGVDEYDELREAHVTAEAPELPYGEEDAPAAEEEGEEEKEGEERLQRVAFSELKAINSEIVAWIEIPGTQISYPVMHTGDNVYYLNHTFKDTVNSAGSIFMETLNAGDFSDLHTIVYGHNMKNGSMFAGLKEYKSPSYFVAHPNICLDLEDGSHLYQIFSCYQTTPDSDSYTIGFAPDEEYEAYLQKLKERSLYDTGVEVSAQDSIITLSTCTRDGEERFLVHARKIS